MWWQLSDLGPRVSIQVDWFEEGNMKGGRKMVISGTLQLVSDLIYSPENLKRANILLA